MIKLNKYLAELGYTQADLPGLYQESKATDVEEKQWNDIRNKDSEEGMCGYEFFDLAHTFDLFIYPRLCHMKEIECGHPMGMTQQQWDKIMDTMIEGFKLSLMRGKINLKIKQEKKIQKAREYLARYYDCLWY